MNASTNAMVKCLIASALVALMMFGAGWDVFGSVSHAEPPAVEAGAEDEYLPPAYAFRAIDYDDPVR